MANDHPEAPKPLGCRPSEQTQEEHKKLIAKIDNNSILLASAVKGSLYFYIDARNADNSSKEKLIDDPFALDYISNDLGIEIRNEDKHLRWVAQAPQALKILEFASLHLKQKNHNSPSIGVNVELKWLDERYLEMIIHLSQNKDQAEWQVTRYI